MKTLLFALLIGIPLPAFADENLNARILALRAERESQIAAAITQANEDLAKELKGLKARYGSNKKDAKTIEDEISDLAKISVVKVPPVVRLTLPLPSAQSGSVTEPQRPRIRKESELSEFLIGTRWNVFGNGEFMDKPIAEIEFTGPDTATWGDKPITWKAQSKDKIWVSGNMAFTFNKEYNEFIGGWIPNSKDRKSGRRIP